MRLNSLKCRFCLGHAWNQRSQKNLKRFLRVRGLNSGESEFTERFVTWSEECSASLQGIIEKTIARVKSVEIPNGESGKRHWSPSTLHVWIENVSRALREWNNIVLNFNFA